jgi:Family of unknown function (DUF5757)
MDRQLKIIEVSLSFQVREKLKTPIDSTVPFVVDRRSISTERVVPVGIDVNAVPDWVFNCKQGYLKFTYAPELQNVECTFRESLSVLTLHGIKQRNFGAFFDGDMCHLHKIFGILGLSNCDNPKTTYKAALVLDVGTFWDRDMIAEVITNDNEVSQIAAVSETVCTLGSRSLFSISVVTESREYARATLRRDDAGSGGTKVTATISRLSKADDSVQVADVIEDIFTKYSKSRSNTPNNALAKRDFSRLSGIMRLRSELPELFINNYTRECPVLPIMVSREQAKLLEGKKSVIFYPLNSTMGRYYTAPDGYYVGLKRNRLQNRDLFPCLVTCYLHDHMSRKGSETYIYYTGGEAANKNKSARPVPRSMGYSLLGINNPLLTRSSGFGYDRRRVPSFVKAVETATGKAVDYASLPWCPQVVKQEMWDVSDEDIMARIRCANCGPLAYRYFEELLKVSIHVVVIKDGMFESLVPSHNSGPAHTDRYIWAPPYPQHVVIFETIRKTYGETRSLYDVLVRGCNMTVFDSGEPAVLSIVAQKSSESVCPPDTVDAVEQLIDERGKCRIIYTSSGKLQMTLTRPLTVPVMPDPECFIDSHTRKMNATKGAMGLPTIDLHKRSTKSILYFPNDASFFYWIDREDQHIGPKSEQE